MRPSEACALLKSQPEGTMLTFATKLPHLYSAGVLIKRPGSYRWYDLSRPGSLGYDTLKTAVYLVEEKIYIWSLS